MVILFVIAAIFFIGYVCIALEHSLHINKAASALFTGVVCWTFYALNAGSMIKPEDIPHWFTESLASHGGSHGHSDHAHMAMDYLLQGQLGHGLAEIAGILFFLLGAMTIVELVDAFEGFSIITERIKARSKVQLLWIISFVTFFLSAVLDNLTTTIVMVSLCRKLIAERETRLFFAGMIVCAANAGGAWTVIGDVTTTMLWIAGKISPVRVMLQLIIPSIVCLVIPLMILSMWMKGDVDRPTTEDEHKHKKNLTHQQQSLMFYLGLAALLSVPVFKMVTHLPPYMGMLLSLSVVWIVSEVIRRDLDEYTKSTTHVVEILKRVDSSAILFFLGILLAINCLAATGVLQAAANGLNTAIGNQSLIAIMIGLISSVVDNVPLVAAGIKMYPQYEIDHNFWQFLAYCAGTGGSCLIIGSAAGVAAMGMERIDFIWYLRKVAPWALLGYLSGAGVYCLMFGAS